MLEGLPQRTDGQTREEFETIVHAFKYAVETYPDTMGITCGEDQATYREYGETVASIAAFLKAQGIEPGDRVGLVVSSSINVPALILGVLTSGAQVSLMNPTYTAREIIPLLDIAEPQLILCDDTSLETLTEISKSRKLKLINTSSDKENWQDTKVTTLPEDLPSPKDGAVIMFTGGTTGISKGVPHNHEKVIAAMQIQEDRWPTDIGTDVWLNVPPLFHITGLYHGCFQPIYGCNGTVLLPRFHPELVLSAIEAHGITTIIVGVPTAYAAMLGFPGLDDVDFSAVKYCGSGGAALADKIKTEWQTRTGVAALEGYGMTEGAPTCNNPYVGQRKSYSAGKPVACIELRIVDVETGTKEMPTGESGEITVRGPHIADEYFNNEEATKAALRDGWLHTGDVAYKDEDGFVFIVDRSKDMAIVSGFNVFPREIDEVLMAHPKILEAAAVGIPDDYRGEVIKAYVAVRDGESLSEEELLAYCTDNLVKYKIPAVVEFVAELPKTPVGKIDKKQLKL